MIDEKTAGKLREGCEAFAKAGDMFADGFRSLAEALSAYVSEIQEQSQRMDRRGRTS